MKTTLERQKFKCLSKYAEYRFCISEHSEVVVWRCSVKKVFLKIHRKTEHSSEQSLSKLKIFEIK